MNTGLGGWVANDTDSLARALAGTGVGLSSLAANRESSKMPHPAITLDTLEPLEIHPDFPPQVAFDDVFAVLDRVDDLRKLLFGQVLGANGSIDIGFGQNVDRVFGANPINVAQGDIDALIRRNFYTNDAGHKLKMDAAVIEC